MRKIRAMKMTPTMMRSTLRSFLMLCSLLKHLRVTDVLRVPLNPRTGILRVPQPLTKERARLVAVKGWAVIGWLKKAMIGWRRRPPFC
jgi:hypothetical protein